MLATKQHKTATTASHPSVKVYSTPTCPYCVMAKEYLKGQHVHFEDIDVSEDHAAAEHMIELSGQMGVPVIAIGKNVIVGFDREAIDNALKQHKK